MTHLALEGADELVRELDVLAIPDARLARRERLEHVGLGKEASCTSERNGTGDG